MIKDHKCSIASVTSKLLGNDIFLLIVVAAVVRVIFSFIYPPKSWPPTQMHLELARQFLTGDFTGYTGRLTPTYAFMMIACGLNLSVLAVVQKLMAVVVTVLVYLIFRSITNSRKIALVAALAYTLNPSQWLFEAAFLTEAMSTFLLAVIVYMLVRILVDSSSVRWWKLTIMGFLSSLLILARPQYQLLALLLLGMIIWAQRRDPLKKITLSAISLMLPVVLVMGSWLAFQYEKAGQATTTLMTGVCIMYHPINFIEYAPEEYSEVKQILKNGIDEYLKRGSSYYGVVEAVIPEIQQKMGYNWAEVDSMYYGLAMATIKAKPLLFAKSVFKATVRFFKPAWYSRQFGIRSVLAGDRLASKVIAGGYSLVHLFLMGVLMVFPIMIAVFPSYRIPDFYTAKALYLYALIIITMSVQAIMVLGENSRYRISVEPFMYGIAIWALWRLVEVLSLKISISRANQSPLPG